jgi:hypothetical protein
MIRAFPKPKTLRDKKYLAFIRLQRCFKCGQKPSDPHHTETGGMGMKGSDKKAVPLCRVCHDRHDRIGKETFWKGWNLPKIIKYYNELYENKISF